MCVAKVAVGPPLGDLVPKLLSDGKALQSQTGLRSQSGPGPDCQPCDWVSGVRQESQNAVQVTQGRRPSAPWGHWRQRGPTPVQPTGRASPRAHLLVEARGLCEVAQEVVGVAQVAVGPALRCSVSQLLHQAQVPPGDRAA